MQLTKDASHCSLRYTAYAMAHGRQPEEQMRHDHGRLAGGFMTGFYLWINERWREWHKLVDRSPADRKTPRDYAEFDLWLTIQVSDLP